ncbi:MAG: helix-turn-helix domain-containing protein [Lachnospiraceae bacterium]|nr:helix-turn-helix domain-containing protein [Lachnospiraceae bacterium]
MTNTSGSQKLPNVLNVKELAEALSISQNTAYNLVRSGQIHSIRIGRAYRITREAVEDFLRKG